LRLTSILRRYGILKEVWHQYNQYICRSDVREPKRRVSPLHTRALRMQGVVCAGSKRPWSQAICVDYNNRHGSCSVATVILFLLDCYSSCQRHPSLATGSRRSASGYCATRQDLVGVSLRSPLQSAESGQAYVQELGILLDKATYS
jgi:hypothetical protein